MFLVAELQEDHLEVINETILFMQKALNEHNHEWKKCEKSMCCFSLKALRNRPKYARDHIFSFLRENPDGATVRTLEAITKTKYSNVYALLKGPLSGSVEKIGSKWKLKKEIK